MMTDERQLETRYVGYDEGARYLSLSEATVRRYVMLGVLPHFKPFGPRGRTLFRLESLDEFMAKHAMEAL